MERLGIRARAQAGDMDRSGRNASAHQLIHVRAPQIEVRTPAVLPREPPGNRVIVMPRLPEGVHDFLPHLSATRSEAGSNRRDEVARIRRDALAHGKAEFVLEATLTDAHGEVVSTTVGTYQLRLMSA